MAGHADGGDPPEAPYLAKGNLHLPFGSVVPLRDGSDIIGQTVAGKVVLVKKTTGDQFDSRHSLVTSDSTISRIANRRIDRRPA